MTRSADLSIDKLGEPDGEQMLNRHLSALVMMHNETMKLDAVTDLWNAGMHTMYQNFIFGTQRNDLMSRLMMDAVQAFAWHKIPKYPYEMRLMLQRSLPVNSTLNFMIVDQEMVDRDRFKEEFETDLSKRGIKALDNLEGPAGTVVTQSQLPVLIQSHTVRLPRKPAWCAARPDTCALPGPLPYPARELHREQPGEAGHDHRRVRDD